MENFVFTISDFLDFFFLLFFFFFFIIEPDSETPFYVILHMVFFFPGRQVDRWIYGAVGSKFQHFSHCSYRVHTIRRLYLRFIKNLFTEKKCYNYVFFENIIFFLIFFFFIIFWVISNFYFFVELRRPGLKISTFLAKISIFLSLRLPRTYDYKTLTSVLKKPVYREKMVWLSIFRI